MRRPSEAAGAMLEHITPLSLETVPLLDALDRVLAQDVVSPIDLPPWDNSAMDGYAVRSPDIPATGKTVTLRVVETIPAGTSPTKTLGPGECARIFTGAPLPAGADAVIRQEDTTPLPPDAVRIDQARDTGKNVRRRGEDIRRGRGVLDAGTVLGPAQLGVLASVGEPTATVHRQPIVAFLASGDEVVDLDERAAILAGTKIASSNTYTLSGMIAHAGAGVRNLGIARDDPADLARRLGDARDADLLVTTGGISVGEHDHVRAAVDALGGRLDFWRVAMRPGAPVGFGRIGDRPWIGLPGNPVSTMVTFELFVRPVIRRLRGHETLFRRMVPVRVRERITLGPKLTHFLRAVVESDAEGLTARLTGPQGSGVLTSMASANALLMVPADRPVVEPGEVLRAMRLDDPVHVAEPPYE